jgi:hypothetical protein
VNQLFLQPFLSRTALQRRQPGREYGINAELESKYNLTVLNPVISGITKIGKQPIQFSQSVRASRYQARKVQSLRLV